MLLAIDVGNTNMVFGIFAGEELTHSFRLTTDADRTSDEIGLLVWEYFQRFGLRTEDVEDVIIASVVPQIMHTLTNALLNTVGRPPWWWMTGWTPACPTASRAMSAWAPTAPWPVWPPSRSTAPPWWW